MTDKFEVEIAAQAAYAELMGQVQKVRQLFEDAEIPCPSRLVRFLGDDETAPKKSSRKPSVKRVRESPPPMRLPIVPTLGILHRDDEILLPIGESSVTSLIFAVMNKLQLRMPAKEICNAVREYYPELSEGTVANALARNEDDKVERTSRGWALMQNVAVPTLDGHSIVGPVDAFNIHDLAAHRRMHVNQVLRDTPNGLTTAEIVSILEESDAIHAPVTKDAVQSDAHRLRKAGKVAKNGPVWVAINKRTDD